MATLHFDERSAITFGGVDISDLVSGVRIEQPAPRFERIAYALPLGKIRITFRGELNPVTYRKIWGRNHPRIRRMHTAYARQHARGRRWR